MICLWKLFLQGKTDEEELEKTVSEGLPKMVAGGKPNALVNALVGSYKTF